MFSELILSIVLLGLVLYGINFSTFRLSVGTLIIVCAVIARLDAPCDSLMWGTGGLVITNSWVVISKLIIVMGGVSLLLMYGSGTTDRNYGSLDGQTVMYTRDTEGITRD